VTFETTLSGIGYRQRIRRWRHSGYHVSLLFLRLPDAENAIARVALRVRQGGHDIPEDVSGGASMPACAILKPSTNRSGYLGLVR